MDLLWEVHNSVSILQETTANSGFANHAPVIDSLTVSSSHLSSGDTAAIRLTVHDPDGGDTAGLVIDAHADCAPFSAPNDVLSSDGHRIWSAQWTAPTAAGSCLLKFAVADGHGAKATAIATMQVSGGPNGGGARVSPVFESYPVIHNITSTPLSPALAFAPGGGTTLEVMATQPGSQLGKEKCDLCVTRVQRMREIAGG